MPLKDLTQRKPILHVHELKCNFKLNLLFISTANFISLHISLVAAKFAPSVPLICIYISFPNQVFWHHNVVSQVKLEATGGTIHSH
jgi:hypothetical protein